MYILAVLLTLFTGQTMTVGQVTQWTIDTCNERPALFVCQEMHNEISQVGEYVHMLDLDIKYGEETGEYDKDHIDMMKMDRLHAEKELSDYIDHTGWELFYVLYIQNGKKFDGQNH